MMVREARPAEREGVLALIRANPELPQWGVDALAPEQQTVPRRRLLVAVDGDDLLGFAQTSLLLGEAELESMAVAESWRGQGIGRQLLRRALELARADGAEVLRLEVRSGNSAARHLYEGTGLVTTGRRRNYYRDPVEDALLMDYRWVQGEPGD